MLQARVWMGDWIRWLVKWLDYGVLFEDYSDLAALLRFYYFGV